MITKLTLAEKKNKTVTVRDLGAVRFSADGKTATVTVDTHLDLDYLSVDEAIDKLTEFRSFAKAILHVETESSYYDEYIVRSYVSAARQCTDEEYERAEVSLIDELNRRSNQLKQQIKQAKALLKSEGLL